jgi:hypothetical protein
VSEQADSSHASRERVLGFWRAVERFTPAGSSQAESKGRVDRVHPELQRVFGKDEENFDPPVA